MSMKKVQRLYQTVMHLPPLTTIGYTIRNTKQSKMHTCTLHFLAIFSMWYLWYIDQQFLTLSTTSAFISLLSCTFETQQILLNLIKAIAKNSII